MAHRLNKDGYEVVYWELVRPEVGQPYYRAADEDTATHAEISCTAFGAEFTCALPEQRVHLEKLMRFAGDAYRRGFERGRCDTQAAIRSALGITR
jgi:hypothetical protein